MLAQAKAPKEFRKIKVRYIVLILLCLFFAALFIRPGTLGWTKYYEAHAILTVNNPFFASEELRVANHRARVKLLDTDSYGRKLFIYSDWNPYLPGAPEGIEYASYLVICQMIGMPNQAFYYEDYSWLCKANPKNNRSFAQFSEEEIAWLKEHNDWNKPLQTEKMQNVSLRNPDSIPYPDYKLLKENVLFHFNLTTEQIETYCVHYCDTKSNTERYGILQINASFYICLVDLKTNTMTAYEEYIGDPLRCHDAMHIFKEKNGAFDKG